MWSGKWQGMTLPSTLRTQLHTGVLCLYLCCPIPVVLRCYLSLTCQGCQVLMDDKQIGWREEHKHQDINNAFFCSLPLIRLSLHTQLLAGRRHGGPSFENCFTWSVFPEQSGSAVGSVWSLSACLTTQRNSASDLQWLKWIHQKSYYCFMSVMFLFLQCQKLVFRYCTDVKAQKQVKISL